MKRTPTGQILVIVSWLLLIVSVGIAAILFYKKMAYISITALAAGIIIAVLLRAAANMGEFLAMLVKKIDIYTSYYQSFSASFEELLVEVRCLQSNFEMFSREDTVVFFKDMSGLMRDIDKGITALTDSINGIAGEFTVLREHIGTSPADTAKDVSTMKRYLENINCDSKDINENIFRLSSFLDDIQNRLDIKK